MIKRILKYMLLTVGLVVAFVIGMLIASYTGSKSIKAQRDIGNSFKSMSDYEFEEEEPVITKVEESEEEEVEETEPLVTEDAGITTFPELESYNKDTVVLDHINPVYDVDVTTRDNIREIAKDIYVSDAFEMDLGSALIIADILLAKGLEKPFCIESAIDNMIWITKDGKGCGFDFEGNQLGLPLEEETATDSYVEEDDGIEAPGDLDTMYLDILLWMNEQIYQDTSNNPRFYVIGFDDISIMVQDSTDGSEYQIDLTDDNIPLGYRRLN